MLKVFGAARWLLGLPPANAIEAPQPVAATTFHRFRELPPEIRRGIWNLALPPPRVYEPEASSTDVLKPVKFLTEFPPPAMREACREAYGVCMSRGCFQSGYWGSRMRGIWYNVFTDAIYYACEMQCTRTQIETPATIYLSADCALRSPNCRDFLMSPKFDYCERLIVAVYPPGSWEMDAKELRGTEPVFRKIKDEESVGYHGFDDTDWPMEERQVVEGYDAPESDVIGWEDAKEVILNIFERRKGILREINEEGPSEITVREYHEGDLEVEAVEVFRTPIPKALPA
ncbi:unnamed protein product [Colletotrichum noveboracense]|uniref:2EXR domain-containing protein n=1 Tax=Colletotrichum noveboracense TaxID=2664923 RepID=A0A9W4W7Z1_9PEZI|nr:hypothetical protein K456DRAFT_1905992 [Colletotrichum gloeosporioides 23]CAI0646273.1 unnamed protein product [Colletotrichum noveboracense]